MYKNSVYDAKYLGFMFCENIKDDMLKQLRTLYTKSNNNILTFSHCTINVNVLINLFMLWMCDQIVSTKTTSCF